MAKINDDRTKVKEVALVNEPTTSGDHYRLNYKDSGGSAWKSGPTTADMEQGSLSVDGDEVTCRQINGTEVTYYITSNGMSNSSTHGFTKTQKSSSTKKNDSNDSNDSSCSCNPCCCCGKCCNCFCKLLKCLFGCFLRYEGLKE